MHVEQGHDHKTAIGRGEVIPASDMKDGGGDVLVAQWDQFGSAGGARGMKSYRYILG